MRKTRHTPINRFIVNHLKGQIIGCVETAASIHKAEQAFACRDIESLVQAGAMLHRLPVARSVGAGEYYLALAAIRTGKPARAGFESVVERGSDLYRTRSLLALGNLEYNAGEIKEAKRFYLEAGRVKAGDWLSAYYAQHNLAVVESNDGNHRQALNRLESIGPLMREVGRVFPAHYFDYLHGLSVEYHYAGNQRAAQECLTHVLASPYAPVYPEWHRTKNFIGNPSRSLVSVACVLDNQASQTAAPRLAMKKIFSIVKSERESDRHEEHLLMQARMEKLDAFVEVDASEEEFDKFIKVAEVWWNDPEKREEINRIVQEEAE